jgi:probable rRNA maturation factor
MPVTVTRQYPKAPSRAVKDDARALLRALGLADAELSVVLCDDDAIRALNARWRGKDEPTDVLSFAMNEGAVVGLDDRVLGDIVISMDTAARHAGERGHPVARELRVLLVHGLLHLRGYDHIEPADAVVMRAKEAELLRVLREDPVGLVERAESVTTP